GGEAGDLPAGLAEVVAGFEQVAGGQASVPAGGEAVGPGEPFRRELFREPGGVGGGAFGLILARQVTDLVGAERLGAVGRAARQAAEKDCQAGGGEDGQGEYMVSKGGGKLRRRRHRWDSRHGMVTPVHRDVEYRSGEDATARRSYKAGSPAAEAEADESRAQRGGNGPQVEDAVCWCGEAVALRLPAVMVQCVRFHVVEASEAENQQRRTQGEHKPSSEAHGSFLLLPHRAKSHDSAPRRRQEEAMATKNKKKTQKGVRARPA